MLKFGNQLIENSPVHGITVQTDKFFGRISASKSIRCMPRAVSIEELVAAVDDIPTSNLVETVEACEDTA